MSPKLFSNAYIIRPFKLFHRHWFEEEISLHFTAASVLQEGRTPYSEPTAAAVGNTGEIVIRNSARKYMQMDIKKKFLWVDPRDNALYTVTSTPWQMNGLVIEVQVVRRALRDGAPGTTPEGGTDEDPLPYRKTIPHPSCDQKYERGS